MTMTAKELHFAQGKTRWTLRAQRPRLVADAKKYKAQTTPPTNINVPAIMGTPTVGFTLTAPWAIGTARRLRMARNGSVTARAIPNATFAKYLLVAADSGQSFTCNVTAFTGGGQASVTSSAVAVT